MDYCSVGQINVYSNMDLENGIHDSQPLQHNSKNNFEVRWKGLVNKILRQHQRQRNEAPKEDISIFEAVSSGDLETVVALFGANKEVFYKRDQTGQTPAHYAAAQNLVDVLRLISDLNEDYYFRVSDNAGNTPLDIAIDNNSFDAIKFLVEKNYNSNREILSTKLFIEPNSVVIKKRTGGIAEAHCAAANDEINFLQSTEDDLNAQDGSGNTPLHYAVEFDSLKALEILLKKGVDTSIQNKKMQAALHLAIELNKIKVLQVMSNYAIMFNSQQPNEQDRTPLHLAAIHDHDECAEILITKFNAITLKRCHFNGNSPLHEAALYGSVKTMKVLFLHLEQKGFTSLDLFNIPDRDGRCLLFSAVKGNDLETVRTCLKYGNALTPLDEFQAFHLACIKGAIDIIKLIFDTDPDSLYGKMDFKSSYHNMSPLHCAIMDDSYEVVEYLVNKGADKFDVDLVQGSPLLFAASISAWKSVEVLIRLGGNANEDARRFLRSLSGEKYKSGFSVIHYACRDGNIKILELLINCGSNLRLKNVENETALHIAARMGRYKMIEMLLDSNKGMAMITESNTNGHTPLHIASLYGHTHIVQLLLKRALLFHRNQLVRFPLHLASKSGFVEIIELFKFPHLSLLDLQDNEGNTALHLATIGNKPEAIKKLLSLGCKLLENVHNKNALDYAIEYGFTDAAVAMVTHEKRGSEVMDLELHCGYDGCVALHLIKFLPNAYKAVLDNSEKKQKSEKSFERTVEYSFKYLHCFSSASGSPDRDNSNNMMKAAKQDIPLPALNKMIEFNRVDLLAHPVSQKYLQMKWNAYGRFCYVANLSFYLIFLLCITSYSWIMMNNIQTKNETTTLPSSGFEKNVTTYTSNLNVNEQFEFINRTAGVIASAICLTSYLMLYLILEIYQIYQRQLSYFYEKENVTCWILYISTFLMLLPVFFVDGKITNVHYSASSIAVFLSWFYFLMHLRHFSKAGIYVLMFGEVLFTLIKVLMLFSVLIIAFGFAFYILMSKKQSLDESHLSFSYLPLTLLRTFAMMLGELDFSDTYVKPYFYGKLKVPMTSFIIIGIFMIFMPILLMNLLIGLAVGDIEVVGRNAQLNRLAMVVGFYTTIENNFKKGKIGAYLLRDGFKNTAFEYPDTHSNKLPNRSIIDDFFKKLFCFIFKENTDESQSIDKRLDLLSTELINNLQQQQQNHNDLLRLVMKKLEIPK